jgi:hypothetical protein
MMKQSFRHPAWRLVVRLRSRPICIIGIVLVAVVVATAGRVMADDEEYPHGEWEGDCETCHSDEGFRPAVIDPEFRRKEHPFPLRMAHDLTDCRMCHRTLEFPLAEPVCVACHLDPHRDEFGTDCERCHVPRNWLDRSRMQRDHHLTRFPLRGTHRALDCEECHEIVPSGGLRFVGTPVDCVACHRARFEGAQDPDHVAGEFPTDCERCHPVTVWGAARFDHRIITEPCASCHLDDYFATQDPDHEAAGFSTDCESCHRPTRWEDGQFVEHDGLFFPIFSGEHRNEWISCSDCHVAPSDFVTFSCLDSCHPHNDEAVTTEKHEDEPGFTYNSNACYACHPDGEAP